MTAGMPAEIDTLIEKHVTGFNTADYALFTSVFGDTAVIIDGIAPFRWMNPNAPANWLADCKKWRETFGVTYENLDYKLGVWSIEENDAYAAITGTLSVTMKGQLVKREGILTYTFRRTDGAWKIEAQAWGRIT